MKVKVLFYHWDWRSSAEMEPIQRAIDAVFDGSRTPRIITEVPTAHWDQNTIAISSAPLDPKHVGYLFEEKYAPRDDDDLWCWWELDKAPVPLEIDVP